jgi:hypothetical protein
MLYTFHLIDRQGAGEMRQRIRSEHKAYLARVADRIAFAGPLLTDDGTTMIGSLLVIDFASGDDAREWLAAEPFTLAGIYEKSSIRPFQNLWPQRAGFVASEGTS